MDQYLVVLIVLLPVICGNVCVPYNFEEDFDTFDPTLGNICQAVNNNWILRPYSSENILPPDPRSETHITSLAPSSCVSSFFFEVENGGVIEVSVYMVPNDILMLGVYNEENQDVTSWSSFANPIPANSWETVRFTLVTNVPEPFRAYLSIFSQVSESYTILIDSFRYIPPDIDENESECAIYNNNVTSTTESESTDNDSTTESLPTESLPTESLPTESLPTESLPTESLPTESLPTESLPTESLPTESLPTESLPMESLPTESLPTESLPTESGATEDSTNDQDNLTDSTEPGSTTVEDTTDDSGVTEGEVTTDSPNLDEKSSFWTPLTKALVATGSCIVLIIIIYISYWCGKRREKKKVPEILYLDIDEIPKTVTVPRVKKVYTESVNSSNPYAREYY